MATTRRALLRKGNVVSLAEARSRREAGLPVHTESANDASREDSVESPEQQQATQSASASAEAHPDQVDAQKIETRQESVAARSALADSNEPESLETVGKKKSGQKRSSSAVKKKGNRTYNKAKVDSIRAAIANGTYVINPQRIADKFIEHEAKL